MAILLQSPTGREHEKYCKNMPLQLERGRRCDAESVPEKYIHDNNQDQEQTQPAYQMANQTVHSIYYSNHISIYQLNLYVNHFGIKFFHLANLSPDSSQKKVNLSPLINVQIEIQLTEVMCGRSFNAVSLILLITFTTHFATAQDSTALVSTKALDLGGDVYAWYDRETGYSNTGLLVGEYLEIGRTSRGSHQFFGEDTWTKTRIRYRDQMFEEVFALYDVEQDILVIRHPTELVYHSQPIKLHQDQIEWFEMYGHTFRYYNREILLLPPGFLDVLHAGQELSFYAKRIKQSRAEQTIVYTSTDRYLIEMDGQFYRFKRLRSFLKLFKDQKKKIRSFVKQNGLKVKKDNDKDLKLLAQFCDDLLKERE